MPLITAAQLKRVAPHADADISAAIVDHADDVLPRYGLATAERLPDFLAHVLVESAYGTTCAENLNYSAERLHAVWPSRFPTVASAEPFAHNPEALADKVYGGRMGNTEPHDGWLFRGQGLLMTTGRAGVARLAARLGKTLEETLLFLTSAEGMLECAAANYVLLGAPACADRGDIVGSTRCVNGGLNGLADRRAALALCRKVWPRVPMPAAPATASTHAPAQPAAPTIPSPTKEANVPSSRMPIFLALFLGLFGVGAAQAAEAVAISPVINDAIGYVVVPALLAVVSGGSIGAVLVMPLKRFLDQKTADILAKRVDDLLVKAIAYGAKEAEAYVSRADFHVAVDGWVQEIAAKYATGHAPVLLKMAGGDLEQKIRARLASHEDLLALKSRVANDNGVPLQPVSAAA